MKLLLLFNCNDNKTNNIYKDDVIYEGESLKFVYSLLQGKKIRNKKDLRLELILNRRSYRAISCLLRATSEAVLLGSLVL